MFPNSVRSPFKLLELSALVSKEMPSARQAFPLTVLMNLISRLPSFVSDIRLCLPQGVARSGAPFLVTVAAGLISKCCDLERGYLRAYASRELTAL
jgi:hypothetical protein